MSSLKYPSTMPFTNLDFLFESKYISVDGASKLFLSGSDLPAAAATSDKGRDRRRYVFV